jgi:hypothetical protein
MAKVRIIGLDKIRSRVEAKLKIAINRALRDKNLRDTVGLIIEKDIRANYNKKASPVTESFREFFEQFNETHPDYRRSKINITFTGELLRDLAKNVKADTVNLALVIEHSEKKHKPYASGEKRKRGKKKISVTSLKSRKEREVGAAFSEQKLTNKEISEFVLKKHDYMNVTREAEVEIVKEIKMVLFRYMAMAR